MKKVTTFNFNQILAVVDDNNCFDLESFCEALKSIIKIKDNDVIENIVDSFVFEWEISSDSDLKKKSNHEYKKLVKNINKIISESR